MARTFKQITYSQRLILKSMLEENASRTEIADRLGISEASVYREIKRGNDGTGYNPDFSESRYQRNLREKGPERIISECPELGQFIAECILKKKLSPERIAESLSEDKRFEGISLTKNTIYNAIDSGLIPGVNRDSLRTDSVKMFSGGHIIVPTWMRETYDLNDGDSFHIAIAENKIITLAKE